MHSQNCEKRLSTSLCRLVCLFICPYAWNKSASTGGIFYEIWYSRIFRKIFREN